MLYVYLDESGDLGLNLEHHSTTKHFVIAVLIVKGSDNNRMMINAVKKTIRRKLNPKNKRKRIVKELKGTHTTLEVKKYFYEQMKDIEFCIYTVVVKKDSFNDRRRNQARLYNYIASHVLNGIQLEEANNSVSLIVDKSKTRPEITQFNRYVKNALEGKIKPSVPFNINHMESHSSHGLQAIDLFCHGIFEKHERERNDWYETFSDRIKSIVFLPK